jgi:pseudouridine-5'-phosphate glycosidase
MEPLVHIPSWVEVALREKRPLVALESTLIAHGLPPPLNLETALLAERVIVDEGVVPVTIGVMEGVPTVGLTSAQMSRLVATKEVLKASRRDLATAVAQKRTAATTVAATMFLANRAGIRVFATGGIGGAHPAATGQAWDISADLIELSRIPVAVVCAGAKGILDLPRTLEILETLGVPVVGYQTDDFPAFYVRSSGERVSARVDTSEAAAELLAAHWRLGGGGVVLAQPVAQDIALGAEEFALALRQAEQQAGAAAIRGKELTPFLLARLAELTGSKTLRANQGLIIANARLAAQVARSLIQSC